MSDNLISIKVDLAVLYAQKINNRRLIKFLHLFTCFFDHFNFYLFSKNIIRHFTKILLCSKIIQKVFLYPSTHFIGVFLVSIDAAEEISIFHLFIKRIED